MPTLPFVAGADMILIQNIRLLDPCVRRDEILDILIGEGKVIKLGQELYLESTLIRRAKGEGLQVIDGTGLCAAPGFVDVHVHLREPGFEYKEDIASGARAALRGGFTTVIAMANTKPVVDCPEVVLSVLKKGRSTPIHVKTCANITKGMLGKELVDMKALKEAGAVGFTDDGIPLMNEELVREAMVQARKLKMPLCFHEENPAFVFQSGINRGEVAQSMGLEGADREAESSMVLRDCKLAKETGALIHIQHISARESVDIVRKAKRLGVKVYAEATPHHFSLTQEAVVRFGTLAKMNPPLRTEEDRMAIIEGLRDGTIDMIATDHAPHSVEEKSRAFVYAPSGILGLETSFSLGLMHLVEPGYLSLLQLMDKMSCQPARLYGLEGGSLREGDPADLVVFDPQAYWNYEKSESKSQNSPWLHSTLKGKILYTFCRGMIEYTGDRD